MRGRHKKAPGFDPYMHIWWFQAMSLSSRSWVEINIGTVTQRYLFNPANEVDDQHLAKIWVITILYWSYGAACLVTMVQFSVPRRLILQEGGPIEELAVDVTMVALLPSLVISCPILAFISQAHLYDSWLSWLPLASCHPLTSPSPFCLYKWFLHSHFLKHLFSTLNSNFSNSLQISKFFKWF